MTFEEELDTLEAHWDEHDFFFLHYKPADAAGEDGDFYGKVRTLEALDACIARLVDMQPDALVVAGDHSTPAILGGAQLAFGSAARQLQVDAGRRNRCVHRAGMRQRVDRTHTGDGSDATGDGAC